MLRRQSLARLTALLLLGSAPAVFAADRKPLATVGDQQLSAEEFERRLSRIPDFQRAALASDPQQLKRVVLDSWIVPDLRFAAEAERRRLGERPDLVDRQRELLREAMDRELRAQSARQNPVRDVDIAAYFAANRGRFETPRRIRIWRILTDDEALAKKVLIDCRGTDGLKRWSQYARDSSIDKSTRLRDGDLGFVHPDGKTDTPTLRVDSTLFAAADALKDGELAAEPLREGSHWALVWRRGSAAQLSRTLAQEEAAIRQVLERERVQEFRQNLLKDLARTYVHKVDSALLDTVQFDSEGVPVREHHEREAHAPAAGASVPAPGERGAR